LLDYTLSFCHVLYFEIRTWQQIKESWRLLAFLVA
jgi:hypothetical protein